MPIELIILGIQAVLRVGRASADLYGEHARDRRIFLPNLKIPDQTKEAQLSGFLQNHEEIRHSPEFASACDIETGILLSGMKEGNPTFDKSYIAMLHYKDINDGKNSFNAIGEADLLHAGVMVEQWNEKNKPPSAWLRMAFTLTDIGLEFITSDPSLLGIGSKGEKLVVAFANNMKVLIPDDIEDFGHNVDFANHVMGIFIRASLGTLASNSGLIFKDKDIEVLFTGMIKPIVDAFPPDGFLTSQIEYKKLVDTLAGPTAEAAFKILSENTESYFGKDFSDGKVFGALTKALFTELQTTSHASSIIDIFSEQGLLRLYQASLGVAIQRPELFVGTSSSTESKLFRELLSNGAEVLKNNPKFNGTMYISLAASMLETLGANGPALLHLNPDQPWEQLASSALTQFSDGLAGALLEGKGAIRSFSQKEILELGRIILQQVSKTPRMLGIDKTEIQSIVVGISDSMATDDNLLLSPNEWIQIAGIATKLAARNPGRLFGLSVDSADEALATNVIKSILAIAGSSFEHTNNSLVVGETLSIVIQATLETLASNIKGISENPTIVGDFIDLLIKQINANPHVFGSESLLKAFEKLIGNVVATGKLPTPTEIENAIEN